LPTAKHDKMKEEHSYESIKDVFTQYLILHQHRKTPERYAILESIYSFDGHFSAETIYSLLTTNYRVSLATVYNTLDLLLACKLVIKHQIGSNVAQYEKAFGTHIHHHSVCTKCGKIKEFSDKQIRNAIHSKTFARFKISHYSLYIYGICSKCDESLKKEKINLKKQK